MKCVNAAALPSATSERIATTEALTLSAASLQCAELRLTVFVWDMSAEHVICVMVFHVNREAVNELFQLTDVIMREFISFNET